MRKLSGKACAYFTVNEWQCGSNGTLYYREPDIEVGAGRWELGGVVGSRCQHTRQ